MSVKTDIEIAREAKTKPIADVAAKIGIPAEALVPYGWTKAKVSFDYIKKIQGNKDGMLILVTAISPTPKPAARSPIGGSSCPGEHWHGRI